METLDSCFFPICQCTFKTTTQRIAPKAFTHARKYLTSILLRWDLMVYMSNFIQFTILRSRMSWAWFFLARSCIIITEKFHIRTKKLSGSSMFSEIVYLRSIRNLSYETSLFFINPSTTLTTYFLTTNRE